jgi:hypothetical protein
VKKVNKFGNKKGAIALLVFIVVAGFFSGFAMSKGIIKPTGKVTFMAIGCMNTCTPGTWIEDRSTPCGHWEWTAIWCGPMDPYGQYHSKYKQGWRHILKVRCTMTFYCHYSETVIEDRIDTNCQRCVWWG